MLSSVSLTSYRCVLLLEVTLLAAATSSLSDSGETKSTMAKSQLQSEVRSWPICDATKAQAMC